MKYALEFATFRENISLNKYRQKGGDIMYKKVIKYLIINLFTLLIVLQVAEINQTNVYAKNKSDIKALKQIIKQQRKKGAVVPQKINGWSYKWDKKNRKAY